MFICKPFDAVGRNVGVNNVNNKSINLFIILNIVKNTYNTRINNNIPLYAIYCLYCFFVSNTYLKY